MLTSSKQMLTLSQIYLHISARFYQYLSCVIYWSKDWVWQIRIVPHRISWIITIHHCNASFQQKEWKYLSVESLEINILRCGVMNGWYLEQLFWQVIVTNIYICNLRRMEHFRTCLACLSICCNSAEMTCRNFFMVYTSISYGSGMMHIFSKCWYCHS